MGCKHCKKVVHIKQSGRDLPNFGGSMSFFVSKKGYGEVEFYADGKRYVFNETKPISAPSELWKVVFLKKVEIPTKSNIIVEKNTKLTDKVINKK